MKTSNKILVIFFLSLMAIYGSVHLGLYAKYKAGKIMTGVVSEDDWQIKYRGKSPLLLAVRGNVNVNVIASDSFFIEYGNEAIHVNAAAGGDSVIVGQEQRVRMNPHGPYQAYDFPWVRIHAGQCSRFRFQGNLVLVNGWKEARNWDIETRDVQIQIGADNLKGSSAQEIFDSLHVVAINTDLILNGPARIERLDLQLDSNSEVNDYGSRIGIPYVRYMDGTRINLTGENLSKLRSEKQ